MTLRPLPLGLLLLGVASAAPRDPVKFTVTLELMRGHYDASLTTLRGGNVASARKHASHPANELYARIKADLTPALQRALRSDFARIDAVLNTPAPTVAQLQAALTPLAATTGQAAQLVAPATRRDPKFIARVISSVAASAQGEYASGVQDGKIANLNEYQDALAFIERAQGWLKAGAARLPADQGGQAASALSAARQVVLAKGPAASLTTQLTRAGTELAEVSGDPAPRLAAGSDANFAAIGGLLKAAKGHYAGGRVDAANESLISAYLDHFESLEAPLRLKDTKLEAKLEVTLRDALRGLVKQRASAPAFGQAIDAAMADLNRAQALLR